MGSGEVLTHEGLPSQTSFNAGNCPRCSRAPEPRQVQERVRDPENFIPRSKAPPASDPAPGSSPRSRTPLTPAG